MLKSILLITLFLFTFKHVTAQADFLKTVGKVKRFDGVRNGDKEIDFAWVMRSFSQDNLLNFGPLHILNPTSHILKFPLGKTIEIPGNISLPNQRENYSIIPFRINKPNYELYVPEGTSHLNAIQGAIPLNDLLAFKKDPNKNVLRLIEKISFKKRGDGRVVVKNKSQNKFDITLKKRTPYSFSTSSQAYNDSTYAHLSIALDVSKKGRYYPASVRYIPSNSQTTLNTSLSNSKRVVPSGEPETSSPLKVLSAIMPKKIFHLAKSSLTSSAKEDQPFSVDQAIKNFFFYYYNPIPNNNHLPSLQTDRERLKTIPISLALSHDYQKTARFLDILEKPTLKGSDFQFTPPGVLPSIMPYGTVVTLSKTEDAHDRISKKILWKVYSEQWIQSITIPEDVIQDIKSTQGSANH